jgi:hypothetical protein
MAQLVEPKLGIQVSGILPIRTVAHVDPLPHRIVAVYPCAPRVPRLCFSIAAEVQS